MNSRRATSSSSSTSSECLHMLSQLYPSPAYAQRVLTWLRSTSTHMRPLALSDAELHERVHAHVYQHKPLAYILGWQPFGSLELLTRPPTLIPRPETEDWALRLSQWLSDHAPDRMRVLDIGTGTGCLPLLLSSEVNPSKTRLNVTGIDVSPSALELARENLQRCHHHQSSEHLVDFQHADLFSDADLDRLGQFDLVVSNPPYISADEFEALDYSVRDWEDSGALVPCSSSTSGSSSSSDGLDCYRRIAQVLPKLLKGDSQCGLQAVVEVGWRQAAEVANLLLLHGQHPSRSSTEVWTDAYGQQRTVLQWRAI